MPDQITPGITSDDAAIFSLNTPGNSFGEDQSEDPFKDGSSGIPQSALGSRRIKSGAFPPDKPLFNLTPGAKSIQWCDKPWRIA